MFKYFKRKIKLNIAGKEFTNDDKTGLTIDFKASFGDKEEPDLAEVEITNLSESTIAAIKKGTTVSLDAGYEGHVGNILQGKVEEVETEWDRVDKVTKITVSDGGNEWKESKIQKTYQAGTTASLILQDLGSYMGYEVAEIEPKKEITYHRGKVIKGSVAIALKQLVKDTGSKMYVNKNRLYVRDKNKTTGNAILLNSDHGLVGFPEKIVEQEEGEDGKKGKEIVKHKVTMLLNHEVTTDSLIQMDSKVLKGNFRVTEGSHSGDFITEITIVPA